MNEMIKNELYTADITGWSSDGAGVCRINGRAVFVKGAIPGEKWAVRILKVTASAAFAKGEELLLRSPERIEPDCPVYGKCGGCALRHVSYKGELSYKLSRVNDAYAHIGGLSLRVDEIIGADETDSYRNKAIYAVGGGPVIGFFRPRSHDVISVDRCLIQPEMSDRAALAVREYMREKNIPAYNEATGKGLVRHVYVRTSRASGQMLVTIVAAGGFGDDTARLVERIRASCPEASGIILNVNKTAGNTVLAGKFYTLWGSGTITDTLCGLSFELSPQSFFQINPAQAEKLYEKAVEYASPDSGSLVLDLYCGAGTISLCLAKRAGRVIGAEIIPEAIENARQNAKRNGIENAEFICADASQLARELLEKKLSPDAVVIDPPRKGTTPETINAICAMKPKRVVYVSCDAATQARDLALFSSLGYTVVKASAVDMFPRTAHVETVAQLSRKTPDNVIHVDLDLTDLPITKAEAAATYTQIKEYVLEQTGMKVSSLYVSQVKRKCGLEVGDSYNKPKNEEAKQPQCPPEKETAIIAALRHYRMIG